MKLERITLPPSITGGAALTTTVVSVADAATNIFGDATFDSTKLTRDISAAYYAAEEYCERAFLTQTWKLTLDYFPKIDRVNPDGAIFLPRGKVQSIRTAQYIDENGDTQTLSDYTLDDTGDPGRLVPTSNGWPSTKSYTPNVVTITYDVGYGTTLPDDKNDIIDAVILALGDLYELRQDMSPAEVYKTGLYKHLLHHYKIYFDFYTHNVNALSNYA